MGSIPAQGTAASQTQTSHPPTPLTPYPCLCISNVSFGNEPELGALRRLSDSDTLGAQEFSPWVKESQGRVIYKRESGEITYFPNVMGLEAGWSKLKNLGHNHDMEYYAAINNCVFTNPHCLIMSLKGINA